VSGTEASLSEHHPSPCDRSRRQLPPCQICGDPVEHRAVARRFCSPRCSGRGHRRIGEDQIVRIIAARSLQIEWATIGRERGASTSTLQRSLRRAQAPIRLPRWIKRENSSQREPSSDDVGFSVRVEGRCTHER
jgi:hypothetical protein